MNISGIKNRIQWAYGRHPSLFVAAAVADVCIIATLTYYLVS